MLSRYRMTKMSSFLARILLVYIILCSRDQYITSRMWSPHITHNLIFAKNSTNRTYLSIHFPHWLFTYQLFLIDIINPIVESQSHASTPCDLTLRIYLLVVGPMVVENIYRSASMVENIYRSASSQGCGSSLPWRWKNVPNSRSYWPIWSHHDVVTKCMTCWM